MFFSVHILAPQRMNPVGFSSTITLTVSLPELYSVTKVFSELCSLVP